MYVVFRTDPGEPMFLERSVAGPHYGKDLTVPVAELADVWTEGASVVYIGKAGGPKSRATLRGRVGRFRNQGRGSSAGHAGGKYVWQLADHAELLVAWKETPGEIPRAVEEGLIAAFRREHGRWPFANLTS